jgi:hypothetical protein
LSNNRNSSHSLSDRDNQHFEADRKQIRSIILILDDSIEYDRIKDLADLVRYRSKMMAYYGFDIKSGRWDTTRFPVTKTDAQMEGIRSDIQRYNDAVQRYNEYAEYLAMKYEIDIRSEIMKGRNVIFRPPESMSTDNYK